MMAETVPATTWYPLAALAERINKTSTDHGFWPNDREDALAALAFLGNELREPGQDDSEEFTKVRRYIEAQSVRNMGEMLMLAVSELAEGLEEHRSLKHYAEWRCKLCGSGTGTIDPASVDRGAHLAPNQELCVGEFKPEGLLVELMDCVIRCLDTALGVVRTAGEDPTLIDQVTRVKMDYNDSRPFKHGRAY